MKEFNARVTALREKVKAWGFQGYTGDSIQDNARGIASSVGKDFIEEERGNWDTKIIRTLGDDKTQRFLDQNFNGTIGQNLEAQLRRIREDAERQQAVLTADLERQATTLRREKEARENKIQGYVSTAEEAYRLKNGEAIEIERAIKESYETIERGRLLLSQIDVAFAKNADLTFKGLVFSKKETVFYCLDATSPQPEVKSASEISASDYKKEYEGPMKALKVQREDEIKNCEARISTYRKKLENMLVEEPYT